MTDEGRKAAELWGPQAGVAATPRTHSSKLPASHQGLACSSDHTTSALRKHPGQ